MIDNIYDKSSKILFLVYQNDFLRYFGEYKKIIRELPTELDTLYGMNRRLDKLILVDDGTLQNWEFQFKNTDECQLKTFWEYNNVKSAQTGKIVDSFVVSFANPDSCDEKVDVGRSIVFRPIIKYLQKMGLDKKLITIKDKIKDHRKLSKLDEITLVLSTLAVDNENKEKSVRFVCDLLRCIDNIDNYRRTVIDSLIAFQIENFVISKEEKEELNEVLSMKIPVEELFLQVEREVEFQNRYEQGFDEGRIKGKEEGKKEGKKEGKNEIILNMLDKRFDFETIQKAVGCSKEHIQKISDKHIASK